MSTRLQGLLRHWVCAPLYDLDEIQQRQEAVEFFLHHGELAQQLRTSLKPGEAEGKGESLEGGLPGPIPKVRSGRSTPMKFPYNRGWETQPKSVGVYIVI